MRGGDGDPTDPNQSRMSSVEVKLEVLSAR